MNILKSKTNNILKNVSTNKKTTMSKNEMLMLFDEYYEKNVSKEDKREIEIEVKSIEKRNEAM